MKNKYETLLADRSPSNESIGKEMFGCLADDLGRVICYFPTKSSFDSHAETIKNKLEEK